MAYYECTGTCISQHMPNLTITWCKAYQNLVLNGMGPLKLLYLCGNLAMVVTAVATGRGGVLAGASGGGWRWMEC